MKNILQVSHQHANMRLILVAEMRGVKRSGQRRLQRQQREPLAVKFEIAGRFWQQRHQFALTDHLADQRYAIDVQMRARDQAIVLHVIVNQFAQAMGQ